MDDWEDADPGVRNVTAVVHDKGLIIEQLEGAIREFGLPALVALTDCFDRLSIASDGPMQYVFRSLFDSASDLVSDIEGVFGK